jgi:hypothetical protein
MGGRYAWVQETLIDERRVSRKTGGEARSLRLLGLSLLCLLSTAAACEGAGARADAGGGSGGADVNAGGSGGDDGRAGTGGQAGTAVTGGAGAGGAVPDPYGRCDAGSEGAVLNSPECPVPNSTCNAWWCAPRCPPNIGTGEDCPLPLSGTAVRVCWFSHCDLDCRGGLVCPDGMECAAFNCRWPAPP